MESKEAREKLVAALTEVRKQWEAGADDWQFRLLRTFREYALAIGIERRLVDPIEKMRIDVADAVFKARRRQKGKAGTPMPSGKALAHSSAAAVATVLKERGFCDTIEQAVGVAADGAKLKRKEVKTFRDNLNRYAFTEDIQRGYEVILAKYRSLTTAALIKEIDLSGFVR
jgi:hypothetical protein